MNLKCFTENARALEKYNFKESEKKINIPVIWGDKDIILSKEQMKETANSFVNGHLIVLEEIGHSPILEAPEEVMKIVIEK